MFAYDREKLYCAMTDTLDACEVEWGKTGVDQNLDVWAENKAELVKLLRRHPDWKEEAMAIITTERVQERVDENAVFELCYRIDNMVYEMVGRRSFSSMMRFIGWTTPKLTENMVRCIQRDGSAKHEPVVGQKTTRFLRQYFLDLGIEPEHKEFWHLFQKLADEINAERIVEHPLIISVNPADYLTISYGTNWASCHIINPDVANTQEGNAYSGCYKAGCLSYLGDESSVVTYSVRALPENLSELPYTRRLTRQMFFVNVEEQCLLQSRLYPYIGDKAMIKVRREIMQGILAECFSIGNSWCVLEGILGFRQKPGSLQYDDYHYTVQNSITTSVPAEHGYTGLSSYIGEMAYCLTCGDRIYDHEHVHCDECDDSWLYCANCEGWHERCEMYLIDGEWYCGNCTSYCEYHGTREACIEEDMFYVEDLGFVCQEALEEGDFFREYWSEWWYDSTQREHITCSDGTCFFDEADARRAGYRPCCECGEWVEESSLRECLIGERLCRFCYRSGDTVHYCEHCGALYNECCDVVCPACQTDIKRAAS